MRVSALGVSLLALRLFAVDVPPNAVQVSGGSIPWIPAPPSLPAGAQIAVLEGDSSKEGMFTTRLRVPAGSSIAPHTHPRDERVTVISGAVEIGFGTKADAAGTKRLGAGSFYLTPPNIPHYLFFPEETVLQITGMGPWKLEYVKPLTSDP